MQLPIDFLKFHLLYVDWYVFSSSWVYPKSQVPYNMLRYIVEGEGIFIVDGKKLVIQKDQVIFIPENSYLECYAKSDNLTFISIRFKNSVKYFDDNILMNYFGFRNQYFKADYLKDSFQSLYQYVFYENPSKYFFMRSNFDFIIASLMDLGYEKKIKTASVQEKNIGIKQKENISDMKIRAAIDYILMHLEENLKIADLALKTEMSESHFRKVFKETTGKSPIDFINDTRLSRAARTLLLSEKDINQIAYEVGFEDPNYFSRKFKEVFSVSPSEYRKISKSN